ncbi:MAG: 3-hydroxyacyl-CoA dehydrogenase family protein [Thermoleophilia bacterium]|nr:3-hydroxyacyl-CoA dehydrogenase family protein [Thermoleophilia bacterium]
MRAVAVVGAGFQGAQIAYRCAQYGLQVAAFDVSRAAMERAEQSARGWAEAHVAAGRLTELEAEDLLARITLAPTLDACVAAVDLVIEAVPEVLTLKQDVWEQIDVAAPPGVLLGTNSSSLKGSDIAVRTARKELTFNVNFGMPAESDLIEVMWNDWTSEPTKSAVRTWLGALGMVYIESKKEIKGYAFNRVWRAVKKECLFLADQGFCDPEDLDRAFIIALEAPTGPFQLMDKIGLDVVRDIELSYYQESGDERDRPPALLEEMVARGDLGRKTGRGFYQYPHPSFEREGWLLKKAHPPEGVSGGAISATQGGQA